MRGAMFMYSAVDGILINVDDIVYVCTLDEAGSLRSGIPKDAVTEMRLRDSGRTHYLREPIEDFIERLRGAIEVLEARA